MHEGEIRKGQQVAWCRRDGSVTNVKITELYLTEGMQRMPAETAGPGDIIAIAGIPEITIGETICGDLENPVALPVIEVEEPALGMTIGINTSPLAGKSGNKLTARMLKDRLDAELVGNVSIRVLDTERPDTWEVQGRGELQLGVLVEAMRREGFELTVGKPQVVTREIDGTICEPIERLTVDVPEEHVGALTQALSGVAQGPHDRDGQPRHRLDADGVPDPRPRPDRLPDGVHDRDPRRRHPERHVRGVRAVGRGDPHPRHRSLVADRRGATAGFALMNLQERGELFVGPGEDVYEGMVIGANARAEDLDVNAVKGKQLTNVRASGSDDALKLTPHKRLSLDQALEFIRPDECVEVTPDFVRLRKVTLDPVARQKIARNTKKAALVAA